MSLVSVGLFQYVSYTNGKSGAVRDRIFLTAMCQHRTQSCLPVGGPLSIISAARKLIDFRNSFLAVAPPWDDYCDMWRTGPMRSGLGDLASASIRYPADYRVDSGALPLDHRIYRQSLFSVTWVYIYAVGPWKPDHNGRRRKLHLVHLSSQTSGLDSMS
jgi:hypothetical protein